MKLLVIRHAIAEDREKFSESGDLDDLRPLTASGRQKMARAMGGVRWLVPTVDFLAASPLVRAQETALIVARAYGIAIGETTAVLCPDAQMNDFAKWLIAHAERDVIAVVGHEPHLSKLVTWLISGVDDTRIELKKGGACLLEFDAQAKRGSAVLLWLHSPKTLRRLSG